MKQQLTRRVLAVFLALGLGLTQLCACSQETDVPGAESGTDVTESAGTTADTADTGIADYTVLDNPGLTIYVDGSAASDGDGTEAAPYRTVTAANEHILELRASDALPEGGIRVLVQPGKYYIPEGLNFGTDGYGSEECPIVWESTEAQGAMLYAGAVIDTAAGTALNDDEKARIIDKDAAEKIVKIDLAAQGYTIDNWGVIYPWGRSAKPDLYPIENPQTAEFFCNSERMTLARYPNSEYLITGARAKAPDGLEGPTFLVHDDNEKSKEVVSHLEQYQTFDDVWVYGYFMHMWSDAGIPVVGTSTNFKKLTVAHEPHYGIGNEHKKYYFFNVFEEIDMPGEYYVDRDAGMLYYYPPQDAASAEIVMTDSAATLVSGGNVSYVTLRGFDLSYTKGNGINLTGDHIMIDDCYVSNVRRVGMNLNGTDITVQNCEITHTGEDGILIAGGDVVTLTKANNLVCNNYIHDWAEVILTFCGGIEIPDGSCGITLSHNEIARSSYYAINYLGAMHTIEYNEIYDVMLNASDGGAICSGRSFTSYGTVIRYNYVHDVGAQPDDGDLYTIWGGDQEALGIYLDDGLSGITVYGNIVENMASYGIMIGGGRDHNIYNNLIINTGTQAFRYDCRMLQQVYDEGDYENYDQSRPNLETICRNEYWKVAFPHLSDLILFPEGQERDNPLLAFSPANSNVINNIVYQPEGNGNALYDIRDDVVYAVSNVTSNELLCGDFTSEFVDYAGGDLTLADNAEVFTLLPEFEPIPFDEIGRINN